MLETPLIINLAPTGAVADHRKNPNVPIAVDTIAAAVAASAREGASIAHLHVRDSEGRPSCEPALYAALLGRLRADPDCRDLVLCASTSGRHGQTPEQRAAVLALPPEVRPEMASLTLGSLNFPTGPSVNAPDTIRFLADEMTRFGVKPELEIFDLGMVEFAKTLIAEGRLRPPYYFNIILGNIGSLACDVRHLGLVIGLLPQPCIVSIGGVGRHQAAANALGLACADGVRVGLEDNLWESWAMRRPATNPGLVGRIARQAAAFERPISAASQTRAVLDLAPAANHAPLLPA